MAYVDDRKKKDYVKPKKKRVVKLDYDALKKGLEEKKTIPEMAREQQISPSQLRVLIYRDAKARKIYDDFTMTFAKMRRRTPVQRYYDRIQKYITERDEKKLGYTRPSLCAYLLISQATYYTLMNSIDQPEWIINKNGTRIWVSVADVFKSFDLLVESSLVDSAVIGKSVGAIFVLKNWYGYRDEKQLNLGKDEPITIEWNEVKALPEKQIEAPNEEEGRTV